MRFTVVALIVAISGHAMAATSSAAAAAVPKNAVSQIGDGQIQAPSKLPSAPPISQIGDGQIQAPTNVPKAPPAPPRVTSAPPKPAPPVSNVKVTASTTVQATVTSKAPAAPAPSKPAVQTGAASQLMVGGGAGIAALVAVALA